MQAAVVRLKFVSVNCMQLKLIALGKVDMRQIMLIVDRIIKLSTYTSGFSMHCVIIK